MRLAHATIKIAGVIMAARKVTAGVSTDKLCTSVPIPAERVSIGSTLLPCDPGYNLLSSSAEKARIVCVRILPREPAVEAEISLSLGASFSAATVGTLALSVVCLTLRIP